MKTTITWIAALALVGALVGCTAEETKTNENFAFEGTCINCHDGLSSAHVHLNYKLRCVDCHGGNDQVAAPADAAKHRGAGGFDDPALIKQAHVLPNPAVARFFYANGIDDDGDGKIDEAVQFDNAVNPTKVVDFGEVFEPGLHGEGAGEFLDTELNRDLNYARFLNPGDLRVASVGCGASNRAAIEGGGAGGCHQQTIDIVRGSIMVNQAAVTAGAYYGNESWRADVITQRDKNGNRKDPRNGAFGYALDYEGADKCIDKMAAIADFMANGSKGRVQPSFNSTCLQQRAAQEDPTVAAGQPGVANTPGFEIAQGTIKPQGQPGLTTAVTGAGDLRLPMGGNPSTSDENAELAPLLNGAVAPDPTNTALFVPDPVDIILRTFRAYYPLNYPGSTLNFNFTFGTSILPEVARFNTANPFGRGHSAGCAACHAPYNYDGSRNAQHIRQDDGSFKDIVDPTTKHREFNAATDDFAQVNGVDRIVGRVVNAKQQSDGRNGKHDVAQQKTYSANHQMTTHVDTKTCGLCHGFVTRINYAYQGMAEEEQRDALSRRAPIKFTTPKGTKVNVIDSWVREDNHFVRGGMADAVPTIVKPDGVKIIEAARKRDADLAAKGIFPGAGGCAQEQFTEDCNNNGELDHNLVLERKDEDGNVVASATIDEDANGNGELDLVDRLPREEAIDGRQMRYVYAGRNGSTRQMDIHFQVGMHCIDCHFMQDVHGDGHVYSTNWDNIEVRCEDCHGTAATRATLKTSGPNGGNDMTKPLNDDRIPFFENRDGRIIQRSRVTPGLFWDVIQTQDINTPYAQQAHDPANHVAEQGAGSEFAGMQGQSEITVAKVECSTCHGSWVLNCVGCHVEVNVGDNQRLTVKADNSVVKEAGENEVWFTNSNTFPGNNALGGHINFQLLGFLRSPLVLGVSSTTMKGRLMPFRSSMQAHAGATDKNGEQFLENTTFTTFQVKDGNTGRMNAATSGVAMNQTMPHTVRPAEARGCETCHSLVDDQGRTRNEHIMAQSFGIGTGALPFTGDWIAATGTNGMEMFEYKQEGELGANKNANGKIANFNQRFPGLIVDPTAPKVAAVEPLLNGQAGNDVVLIRNFNATPALGSTQPPTLKDLAVLAVDNAGAGSLVITDVSQRGHSSSVRPAAVNGAKVSILNFPAGQVPQALAHVGSDVSEPFVYVALGAAGVACVEIRDAPPTNAGTQPIIRDTLNLGKVATSLAVSGDLLYVGTQGSIEVVDVSDPQNLKRVGGVALPGNPVVNDVAVSGFLLYAATTAGTTALALDDVKTPGPPNGAAGIQFIGPTTANGIYVFQGIAYVAAGAAGVHEIDFRVPAAPVDNGDLAQTQVAGQPRGNGAGVNIGAVNAVDVIVSRMPGQVWVLALEATGNLVGLKLDNTQSLREKCYPDPVGKGCVLDMEFRDPTQMSRDPSFDPTTGKFDAATADASAVTGFRITSNVLANGAHRLARPALWEQLNTLSGRRYRDSFMPGSGSLSLGIMQTMRNVQVCEVAGMESNDPTGLNALGFFQGGSCQPFGVSARAKPVCRASTFGGPVVCKVEPLRVTPKSPPPGIARAPVVPGQLTPTPAHVATPTAARAGPVINHRSASPFGDAARPGATGAFDRR